VIAMALPINIVMQCVGNLWRERERERERERKRERERERE